MAEPTKVRHLRAVQDDGTAPCSHVYVCYEDPAGEPDRVECSHCHTTWKVVPSDDPGA